MSKLAKTLNIFSIAFLTLFALFARIVGWLNPDAGGEAGLWLFAFTFLLLVPSRISSSFASLWHETLSSKLLMPSSLCSSAILPGECSWHPEQV